jgi:hypothetical protein
MLDEEMVDLRLRMLESVLMTPKASPFDPVSPRVVPVKLDYGSGGTPYDDK